MHTNDEYFFNFCNLANTNIGLYQLDRDFPEITTFAIEKGISYREAYDILMGEDYSKIEFLKKILKCHERDAVILMSHEAEISLSLIENLPDNVFYFDTLGNLEHQRYALYFYFFGCLRNIEKTNAVLHNLLDYTNKSPEYVFECLLGMVRPHRNFVYDKINSSDFKEQVLTSYFGKTKTWVPGCVIDSNPNLTGAHSSSETPFLTVDINNFNNSITWVAFNQYNLTTPMSFLLPWQIHNNSWYSIITETKYQSAYFTEKTAKALLGGRIFVLFSGRGSLRSLRQAGFQTFGDIIDESYDDVDDHDLRFSMAWKQIEALAQTDPREIYKKFGHITQHNQQHFMNTDWDDKFRQNVYRLLNA
jgi:hypothetical protein